jgi:hypothetical protein
MTDRERLPNRRASFRFNFEHDGHRYCATGSRFADGRLAEIFIDLPAKMGSPLHLSASTAAILVSLLLQHGVEAETIRHSIEGPIAAALELAVQP